MTDTQLQGRVAVVTGASRGIGYHLAKALAAEGVHVIALARTVGGLEDLDDEIKGLGGSATLVPLDLMDYDGIDRLGAAIFERWGKLDMLVGNAGMLGGLSPLGHIDIKTFDKVMALNVTANWRLIRSLDPLLRQSDAGRAVFLTSSAAHKCKPFWGVYSASKAALEALVRTYAAETQSGTVRVNLLNPGAMRTAMRAKAMPGEDPDTLPHPSEVAPQIIAMLRPDFIDTGRLFDRPSGMFKDFVPLVV
ncbi:SDR family NAD(P)-dependent oxidoreductase [Pannonibacter carbonis]|uniref:SDR family NAD(P)-dependent oxidoreductase n=1 Tax=Pannonibacter carbonis TaxID=2067569 RepID=UPI000D0E92F9|nr:SDR family NAD(P)-dependent oxidoreductase [Pannonibacter carbonis]